MKNKDKKGTGFICNWDFFMRNQCARCPIKRLCDENEERNKIPNTKKVKQSNNNGIQKK